MSVLTLSSLPQIHFAHSYSADSYHGFIPARPNRIEISVIVSGGFCVTQDQKSYLAGEGDIIFNLYGSDMTVVADEPHCHHTVCFTVEHTLREGAELPLVLRGAARDGRCRALIDEIVRCFALRSSDGWREAGLFLQLMEEVVACVGREAYRGTHGENRYVAQAKRYVLEHISQPVTQGEIAAHLGITPEYLCNVFKKSEGRTLMRFVNETKLTLIRNMMESKGLPLYQAALQYGYADPNYVSRLYKKYYHRPITAAVREN